MSPGQTVAIVGIGGIFPGADNPDRFWENILQARDFSREPPPGRWSLPPEDVYQSEPAADKVYSSRACFVEDSKVDLDGLDIDSALVTSLDPMFRLLLHAGKQAWRDAVTANLDRQRVGIIIGNIVLPTDASSRIAEEILGRVFASQILPDMSTSPNAATHPLNRYVAGLPATVLARSLGLGGGSFTLDAACASSLYSLKFALEELQSGRADAMLCGGLSRPDSLYTQMGFASLGALSASGHCSPFDHKADGLVVGEGSGILVLKRLDDALRDNDHIYATIAGIGLSNDIHGNLMLPDSEGQLRAMTAAYHQADWQPDQVDLIECHGTGTPAGDKTEYRSMRSLWGQDYDPQRRCVIGSVKSNIGHLLTAAGAAGLIKVLMAFRHRQLPPTANFSSAADGIDLEAGPFSVLNQARDWDTGNPGQPRRAAVSAFGFGGINAHVLLQEWRPEAGTQKVRSRKNPPSISAPAPEPIAVVGMDTHFGPWQGLQAFGQRVLGGYPDTAPQPATNRWGVEAASQIPGYTIDKVEIPLGRFRIPPRELEEMLPQQLLMLQVAANALDDAGLAGIADDHRTDTGAFIGIGLDLNTTNFHLRWSLLKHAGHWARQAGYDLDAESLQAWTRQLADSAGPPLTANRTMGALGGIVASRIARAFNLGGSSFTISSEESSGLHALETAVRTLQRGELNIAITGAVDLAGDVRAVSGQDAFKPGAGNGRVLIGEGAVALVLKRYRDAVRDGDRIYSLITGIGSTTAGKSNAVLPTAAGYREAAARACADAQIEVGTVSYIETHGSGNQQVDAMEAEALAGLFTSQQPGQTTDKFIGCLKADIGHAGAAGGLAAIARASLCAYRHLLPGYRLDGDDQSRFMSDTGLTVPEQAQYWLRNRTDGPRRAMVSSISIGGNSSQAIIEEVPMAQQSAQQGPLATLADTHTAQLFSIQADSSDELQNVIDELDAYSRNHYADDIRQTARYWYQQQKPAAREKLAVSLIAESPDQLQSLLAEAKQAVQTGGTTATERLFYTDRPLSINGSNKGKLAFVFPGSGNHFIGMGRDIALRWPHILDHLDSENESLAAQFANSRFWNGTAAEALTHEDVIFGQVWLGTFISDVICSFGIRPDAVIGYSLGETAGLFATRAWTDRDLMLQRLQQTPLFTTELAGPCNAAREVWGLSDYVAVDWRVGVINYPADKLQARIKQLPWVYLLITNTPDECVIGGNAIAVESLIKELGCSFHPLDTITTVHCELARPVQQAYRELHLFETTPPQGITFYSGILGKAYEVSRDSTADSITGQAVAAFDYTRVINSAWEDGTRLFVEMGPGASCTRMISRILADKPHAAQAICVKGRDGVLSVLRTLALLDSHRVEMDLSSLYSEAAIPAPVTKTGKHITVKTGHAPIRVTLPPPQNRPHQEKPAVSEKSVPGNIIPLPAAARNSTSDDLVIQQMLRTESARAMAHETYLRVSNGINESLSQALSLQLSLLQSAPVMQAHPELPFLQPDYSAPANHTPPAFDRDMCMEFAIGSIGKVLGPDFAVIDSYPTRVRLPDEPLMLVDRILEVDAEPGSLGSGRVITEHDIHPHDWYLDGGRIPTCIAVESGQADLFLSGYLGIDHYTRGLAVYRLLDAEITFHDGLPGPGNTIHYDIRIDHFFKQGDTRLFRFSFEGSVDGKPLLSMQNGCAGFFTQAELEAGKGIVLTSLEQRPLQGIRSDDWTDLVPMQRQSFDDEQISALRNGDLEKCFGPLFAKLPFRQAAGLPGGLMTLVDRILDMDPAGGRYGLGMITGEADIQPDDWFLTCHFVDDQVMPGTLMYECCLHTLRVYLLRMGWVGEADEIIYEPVAGITSKLKCRGQVIATTSKVQYEISLKEIGYSKSGTPYVLADALMSADGRAIVQMSDMSLQLTGLEREQLLAFWQERTRPSVPATAGTRRVLFDSDSILAFAIGKPSEAFGDRYQPFDHDRVIARLPGPPYQFLDRIVAIEDCEPWQLQAGGTIEAEYDVPADAWYFAADRQQTMPFSILLEVALQPCGWLAAYLGSALNSDKDLSFRNLGGKATQLLSVSADTGTLTTRVTITNVAHSGGMIIQNFDYQVRCKRGVVYQGDTYFGFFSKQALANQVGIRDAAPWQPTTAELSTFRRQDYPTQAPFPADQLRMVDTIDVFTADGGPHGLGYIRGTARVRPDAWFFKAHFYQDPVWPGSLGLESFIQLLKYAAVSRWHNAGTGIEFESMASQQPHSWLYRGQIIPTDAKVTVEATIKEVDDHTKLLKADGFLTVDGRIIYQMSDFTLRMSEL